MNAFVILFVISHSWFGGSYARELLRFEDIASCEAAKALVEQQGLKAWCLSGVIAK